MTDSKTKMIDPVDVQKVIDRHSLVSENMDCKNVLDDVLRDLRDLLPKPDCPEDMLGMWAEHPEHGRVLVCSAKPDEDGEVEIAARDDGWPTGVAFTWVAYTTLSFPEQHPETLTTPEDYENAPEGTIVEYTDNMPYMKKSHFWVGVFDHKIPDALVGTSARVLRWGWVL